MSNQESCSIFISYSHRDEEMKYRLEIHLSTLRRQGKIKLWSDRDGEIGDDWDTKIKEKLSNSKIILLLVSADFNASDYIWGVEIEKAMRRHDKKEAKVIPIFLKKCDFANMPYARLQGLPRDRNGKLFISEYPEAEQENIYASIVREIRKLVEEMLVSPTANRTTEAFAINPITEQTLLSHDYFHNLIAENNLGIALQKLRSLFPNNDLLINLSGQLADIENQRNSGLIHYEDTLPIYNRVRKALIQLLSELDLPPKTIK